MTKKEKRAMIEKSYEFEVGGEYDTDGGWKARVLALDGPSDAPMIVLHFKKDSSPEVACHQINGNYYDDLDPSPCDLIPPKRELFAVYHADHEYSGSTPDKTTALKQARGYGGYVVRFVEEGKVENE